MKIEMPRKIFKAALHCAAVKDRRHYLQGVCLRLNSAKGQAYATNGSILFVCRFDVTGGDSKGPFDVIIPLDAIKHASRGKTSDVELSSLEDGGYLLDGFRFIAIEGSYPDISRVIPEAFEPSIGNYDPSLLILCDKALKAWFDRKGLVTCLFQNGRRPAIVQGADDSGICVIMPRVPPTVDAGSRSFSCNFKVMQKAT